MAQRSGRLVHVGGEEPLGTVGVPHEIPLQHELWIGRVAGSGAHEKAQVVIAKPYVSGTHCRLWQEHGQVLLTDLSSNGTFVNGEVVGKGSSVQLNHGDTIAFVFRKAQKIVYELNLPQAAIVLDDAPQEALVAKLREEIAELQAKVEATEQAKRQLNAEAESTVTLQRQVQLLQEIRDTNEACIADLTNKLETERREARGLQRTVQREQAEAAAMTKQVEEMRTKIRQQVDQMAQLQAQLTAAQESELSAKSALELSRSEIRRLTEDADHLDALNTKWESLQSELERKTGEMQSTKTMLETTSTALQDERHAHAETKRLLDVAQDQVARLNRQHLEADTLARTRADKLKGLSAQLQSTSNTNSRSRAVIESLEHERAALLRGIATVQGNERERVAGSQRALNGILEDLSRLTASVRWFGDNLAVDFSPLELEDHVDNSCTQHEQVASPQQRTRIADETPGNTQSSDEGTSTPPRHPVTPSTTRAGAANSVASEEASHELLQSGQLQQHTPPPKRAMAFDSSSDGENETQQGTDQAPASATKRARTTRSQSRSQALSQEQNIVQDQSEELALGQAQAQSTTPAATKAQDHSMAPPQTSSDYDVTQMPVSPRTRRRSTRQWPLDSMESELPNPSSIMTNSHNASSNPGASRQTLSADKHPKASSSSSSHIPSEWDVPDLSFSTNAPVASMSKQAQTFDATQAPPDTAQILSHDSVFDDLH